MAKAPVTKISDKLVKVNESYTVYQYDNGFMFEIGGRDKKEDWANVKLMCPTLQDVIALVSEAAEMPKDS